jgi:hypothetical protein
MIILEANARQQVDKYLESLSSALSSCDLNHWCSPEVCAGRTMWSGAGSNRRPSAFQKVSPVSWHRLGIEQTCCRLLHLSPPLLRAPPDYLPVLTITEFPILGAAAIT